MVESFKIKARIIELKLKQSQIVEEFGKRGIKMAYTTLNQKINNTRTMSLEEAIILQDILQIPDQDFKKYFFSTKSPTPVTLSSE